jgi:hypothetical protein
MIGLTVSVRGIFPQVYPLARLIYYPVPTSIVATYDNSGQVDYIDVFKQSAKDYKNITKYAGMLELATSIIL